MHSNAIAYVPICIACNITSQVGIIIRKVAKPGRSMNIMYLNIPFTGNNYFIIISAKHSSLPSPTDQTLLHTHTHTHHAHNTSIGGEIVVHCYSLTHCYIKLFGMRI